MANDLLSVYKGTVNKINTNIGELESAVNKLEQSINQYYTALEQLAGVRNRIESAWEGMAAQTYKAKLDADIRKVNSMIEMLKQVKNMANKRISLLKNTRNWYYEIMQSLESMIGSGSGGGGGRAF